MANCFPLTASIHVFEQIMVIFNIFAIVSTVLEMVTKPRGWTSKQHRYVPFYSRCCPKTCGDSRIADKEIDKSVFV